jgi:hypothetical protein
MIETARVTRIEGRIVNVSSQSHHFASVRDLSLELLNSGARYLIRNESGFLKP